MGLLDSSEHMPAMLRPYVLIPLTVLFIIVTGMVFTLPPGPLCDEGMILFMKGGCDWGRSNIFFFSKIGLLVAANVAFLVAWRTRPPLKGIVPSLVVLTVLGAFAGTDTSCDQYYGHPNGNAGQMAFDILGFSIFGLALSANLLAIKKRTTRPSFAATQLGN